MICGMSDMPGEIQMRDAWREWMDVKQPTGYGLDGEVTETRNCPRVLISFHKASAVVCVVDKIEVELSIRFDRIDTGLK